MTALSRDVRHAARERPCLAIPAHASAAPRGAFVVTPKFYLLVTRLGPAEGGADGTA